MSVSCGLECVVCLGCIRWLWKRCTYIGSYDSQTWPPASPEEFSAIPRICRVILAVYEADPSNPRFTPAGPPLDPSGIIKRVPYDEIPDGRCPPYIIYLDRVHKEIILAIRGLNLVRESDYKVLLDNRLGRQMSAGGYVHHGLLGAATWLLNKEGETLKKLLEENGEEYRLVFAGHSLGSGIAALMTIIVLNNREEFGGIERRRIRCYAVAPARCMSLNLAVKYADVIYSVILQDDFLPRTATPLEHIFGSIFCLPCLLFLVCMRDTFIPEKRKLNDPRRLYAPGRMYHIVERKFCRCGRFPPEVRTAIPVEGRFEHVVLSCNATADHGIVWIEREAQKALEIMKQSSEALAPPTEQKMNRKLSHEEEHRHALQRAVTLSIPHAVSLDEVSLDEASHMGETEHLDNQNDKPTNSVDSGSENDNATRKNHSVSQEDSVKSSSKRSRGKTNWDELVEKLFAKNESGNLVLKKDMIIGEKEDS